LNLLAALGIRLVLVHGARPQIEAELRAKGVRSPLCKGIADHGRTIARCSEARRGVLRVELEALLSQGLPNSPMAGAQIRVASGNYITARPIGIVDGVDYQFTGEVRKIDAAALARRLDAGEVVLVPHIGYSPTGEVFNLAWEDVAESVALALKADKLLLLTDRLPADRKGKPLNEVTVQQAELLVRKDGQTPHAARALKSACRALAGGVGRVHLISRRADGGTLLELFTHAGAGTMITADPVQQLRPAKIEDVGGILALIEPLEADGTLVKRNREMLEREIGNFEVLEHDGMIAGCAALYPMAEAKERRARLPRGLPRVSRRRLRRAPAAGMRNSRQDDEDPAAVCADHARGALVHRAGLSRRRRRRAARAAQGALQLEARLEGIPQAPLENYFLTVFTPSGVPSSSTSAARHAKIPFVTTRQCH
jgi:amino-acid N-acetyltransferase